MSPQQNQKIERLLNLLKEALFLDNLNRLIWASHELSQEDLIAHHIVSLSLFRNS